MLTRAEAFELIRELVDDPEGVRWRDRQLVLYTTVTLDSLWGQILQMVPLARVAEEELEVVEERADLEGLEERLFRIQEVRVGERRIPEGPGYWKRMGSWLYLGFPAEKIEVLYSHRPPRFKDLGEEDLVPWPDGHEDAYLHEVAGRLLTKGGAEDPSVHLQIARESMQGMYAVLQRSGSMPLQQRMESTPAEWGSM